MTKKEIAMWQDRTPNIAEVQTQAENGDRKAQSLLAACYKYGWHGLPKDETLANYWKAKNDLRN